MQHPSQVNRCATENELLGFAEGTLDTQLHTWVERHVDSCAECMEILAEALRADSTLTNMLEPDEPTHNSNAPKPDASTQHLLAALADKTAYGQKIGRYVLLSHLGQGGMGFVYTAYDPKLDRTIALKLIRPDFDRATGRTRLMREAQAAARLKHPNVVTIYEAGEAMGLAYIALEYVQGASVRQWLRQGPHPWRRVLSLFLEAGAGLAAAHRAGILHRDFKPDNILLDDEGHPKVADFGLAAGIRDDALQQTFDNTSDSDASLDMRLTQTGTLLGTPPYMAPEQHLCADVDARADIYSFAVSLYEALTGTHPFADATTLDQLLAAKQKPPVFPSRNKVPGWLRAVVIRGLQPDPAARWPTLDAMLTALRANPAVRRGLQAAVATIAVGVVGVLGFQAYERSQIAEACRAEGQAIYDIWTPKKVEQIGAAFAATKLDYTQDSWERARPRVDAYVDAYATKREDLCRAGELNHSIRPALLARARECFDRGEAAVEKLATAWTTPKTLSVTRAPGQAASLPWIGECTDTDRLARIVSLDAHVPRQTYEALRTQYRQARQVAHEADAARARDLAVEVEREALAVGAISLASAASLTICNAYQQQQNYPEVETACTRSYLQSVEASDHEGAVHAAAFLANVYGQAFHQQQQSQLWLDIAKAHHAVIASDGPDPQGARLQSAQAYFYQDFNQPKKAIAAFRTAIAQYNELYGEMSDVSAPLWTSIAYIAIDQEDWATAQQAIDQARTVHLQVFGPRHPLTSQVEWYRAVILHASDPSAANEMFEASMAMMPPRRAARYQVAWRDHAWQSCGDSLAPAQQAIAAALKHDLRTVEELPLLLVKVGTCHRQQGDKQRALAAGKRALELLQPPNKPPSQTYRAAEALATGFDPSSTKEMP